MQNMYYAPEVIKDIVNLEKQINEEKEKPQIDSAKINKMRWQQFYRGLEMNSGFLRPNNKRPY